jgi:hypothetical protein
MIIVALQQLGYPFGPGIQILVLTVTYRDTVGALRISELSQNPDSAGIWTYRPADRSSASCPFDIPLPDAAVRIIQASLTNRRPGSDFLFSATCQTPASGWSRAKRRLDAMVAASSAENASMAPWRLNDLRASFAKIADDRLGSPPMVIERCRGRVSRFAGPLSRKWAQSEAMFGEHRRALAAWADLIVEAD